MSNYKVKVNSESEAEDVKHLAVKAGYTLDALFGRKWSAEFCYLLLCKDMSAGFGNEIMADGDKILSNGELRAMVHQEQDEPFLTPETTLNDQYAEIEEVRQAIREETQAASGIDATLAERQSQYGCYEDVAHVTQEILKALRVGGYDRMPAPHKEAMHMIASKMARIVNGDFNSIDGWHDISGYATLIERLIGSDNV